MLDRTAVIGGWHENQVRDLQRYLRPNGLICVSKKKKLYLFGKHDRPGYSRDPYLHLLPGFTSRDVHDVLTHPHNTIATLADRLDFNLKLLSFLEL